MNNKLGEIFYNGRILNLNSLDDKDLQNILNDLETNQAHKKENIKNTLKQMEVYNGN